MIARRIEIRAGFATWIIIIVIVVIIRFDFSTYNIHVFEIIFVSLLLLFCFCFFNLLIISIILLSGIRIDKDFFSLLRLLQFIQLVEFVRVFDSSVIGICEKSVCVLSIVSARLGRVPAAIGVRSLLAFPWNQILDNCLATIRARFRKYSFFNISFRVPFT